MRQIHSIYSAVLVVAVLIGAIPNAFAQSGFPPFSPEPEVETVPSRAPSTGFPPFTGSEEETPQTVKRNAFPAAGESDRVMPAGRTLDMQQLGAMIREMGLEPYLVQSRYDFQYLTEVNGQEIELSLSAVLRENNSVVHVKAWLDPLPAGIVPGEPLLEMLARNEEMHRGLRFAYSRQMGRFLLEKTVPNRDVTPQVLTRIFDDVSQGVTENWSVWSTSNWKNRQRRSPATSQEVISEEKFEMPIRR